MGFFGTLSNYIEAKNKLKEILYNSKNKEDLYEGIKKFEEYVDKELSNLDKNEKFNIINEAKDEFERKALQLKIENFIKG